jgi:hypothetical protein
VQASSQSFSSPRPGNGSAKAGILAAIHKEQEAIRKEQEAIRRLAIVCIINYYSLVMLAQSTENLSYFQQSNIRQYPDLAAAAPN